MFKIFRAAVLALVALFTISTVVPEGSVANAATSHKIIPKVKKPPVKKNAKKTRKAPTKKLAKKTKKAPAKKGVKKTVKTPIKKGVTKVVKKPVKKTLHKAPATKP